MVCSLVSKNPTKKYRPVSNRLNANNELTCLCEGMFWTIIIQDVDRHLIPVDNPHFRLVLRPNLQLQGYYYGIKASTFPIRYHDITLPHQVTIVKTEYVSRFHGERKEA